MPPPTPKPPTPTSPAPPPSSPHAQTPPQQHLLLLLRTVSLLNDLANLCAVGTLDLAMPRRAAPGMDAPDGWLWLEPPAARRACPFARAALEGKLVALVEAGWARCTYRMRGKQQQGKGATARVRVYVLPDDVGRTYIGRGDAGLRRCLKAVVAEADAAPWKWAGGEVAGGDAVQEGQEQEQEQEQTPSLFYMFNTLKSPAPDPGSCWIKDDNTKELMAEVLTTDLPEIRTTLYRHQKRAVATMLQKELAPEQTMDPRLAAVRGPDGAVYFRDSETAEFFQDPRYFEDVRGGILAEEMGTGKTLLCLALILASKSQISFTPAEHEQPPQVRPAVGSLVDMCVASIWRNAVPWKHYAGTDHLPPNCERAILASPGHYCVPPPQRSRSSSRRRHSAAAAVEPAEKIYLGTGTIVVCPANLVEQWQGEIEKHLAPGALSVLTLEHAKDRIPPAPQLLAYDVLLFSRARFDKEAREGLDAAGRRAPAGSPLLCACPYIGATRTRNCACFRRDAVYRSPLMGVRWKRLIVDEGHSMASGAKTHSVLVADRLPVERRWIVTGTPTSELVGLMTGGGGGGGESGDEGDEDERREQMLEDRRGVRINEAAQLERVGKMVCDFLKQEPWTPALWRRYMGPRRMRAMLERVFVRHRPADIAASVQLPPLHHRYVPLRPGRLDRISMNLFVGALAANAVTSERAGRDYMFHRDNKAALRTLTDNLLKRAGFYWSGHSAADVRLVVETSARYLQTRACTPADQALLGRAIAAGKAALDSETWRNITTYHEMVYFLSDLPDELADGWAFGGPRSSDGLVEVGGAQIQGLQRALNAHGWLDYEPLMRKLADLGHAFRQTHPAAAAAAAASPQQQPKSTPTTSSTTSSAQPAPPRFPDLTSLPLLSAPRIVGTASAKLSYLLRRITADHATSKTLIFHDDPPTAFHLAQALAILGIPALAYSGAAKAAHLRAFQQQPASRVRVLLMDLRCAAHGLNAAAASRVYFVAPVWRADVETQALRRAHRIGQTRPVHAETLYLAGTAEEAVLKRRQGQGVGLGLQRARNVVDDEGMCAVLRAWEFLPEEQGEEGVCALGAPEPLFGAGRHGGVCEEVEGSGGGKAGPKRKRALEAEVESPLGRKRMGFGAGGERDEGGDSGGGSGSGSGSGQEGGARVVRLA